MKPDNGCNNCKFYVDYGECKKNSFTFFDTKKGVDVTFYGGASAYRDGKRHCRVWELKPTLWQTIKNKILGLKVNV